VSPRAVSDLVFVETPLLHASEAVGEGVERLLDSGFPALPVVDDDDRLVGIFGEREFVGALFPQYLQQLSSAHFVRKELDATLEKRASLRGEPVSQWMNSEHIDVRGDFSDAEVAEIFLHHRVLLLPVTEDRRVLGVITRTSFFRAVAERFLALEG